MATWKRVRITCWVALCIGSVLYMMEGLWQPGLHWAIPAIVGATLTWLELRDKSKSRPKWIDRPEVVEALEFSRDLRKGWLKWLVVLGYSLLFVLVASVILTALGIEPPD